MCWYFCQMTFQSSFFFSRVMQEKCVRNVCSTLKKQEKTNFFSPKNAAEEEETNDSLAFSEAHKKWNEWISLILRDLCFLSALVFGRNERLKHRWIEWTKRAQKFYGSKSNKKWKFSWKSRKSKIFMNNGRNERKTKSQ